MRENVIYFIINNLVSDDPSVDVGIETIESSDFKTATIILGIITVICIGTSAGIIIWLKRKTKGTGNYVVMTSMIAICIITPFLIFHSVFIIGFKHLRF
jgi:hypothetical protein